MLPSFRITRLFNNDIASYLLVGLTEFQQEVANNLQVLIITTLTLNVPIPDNVKKLS